ncbi:hypothetical protein [Hellea balneolensis]|uniref:hypothetical protein n=1 Tax=Hellea balneolensis TaxID=287478 RepID=UPI000406EF84|nr:hypothetical protein [Hellea balneolensis]
MTYLRQILIVSAASLAFTASPALAGDKTHKDHMKKTHVTATHSAIADLTPSERTAWETKIKANMSAEKQAKWATYSEDKQRMWMDKKIMKMMSADASQMKESPTNYQNAEKMLRNDTAGEILQADGDADPETDRKLLMSNGKQMTKSKLIIKDSDNRAANNAIAVPAINSDILTTVSCPVGTTAQPDMTCLVTGNYAPTS